MAGFQPALRISRNTVERASEKESGSTVLQFSGFTSRPVDSVEREPCQARVIISPNGNPFYLSFPKIALSLRSQLPHFLRLSFRR